MQHLAVYPGSFDPVSFGHLDVIARGRRLFDRVVVAVGRNPGKEQLFSVDERLEMIRLFTDRMNRERPDLSPVDVQSFGGLTMDFARSVGATALLRGIRNLSDLQSEVQQALTNRQVAGLETAFVVAGQDFAYTSSSLIKQIAAMSDDLTKLSTMVPAEVIERLQAKKAARDPVLEHLRADQE